MPSPLEIEVEQIVHSEHFDPFHVFGAHAVEIPSRAGESGMGIALRAFLPEAQKAWVIPDGDPGSPVPTELAPPDGLLAVVLKDRHQHFPCQLRLMNREGPYLQFV